MTVFFTVLFSSFPFAEPSVPGLVKTGLDVGPGHARFARFPEVERWFLPEPSAEVKAKQPRCGPSKSGSLGGLDRLLSLGQTESLVVGEDGYNETESFDVPEVGGSHMAKQLFTYTVVYESDPETGYICASVPALELGTHGRTLEEARAMMREALQLHLEGLLEEKIAIPPDVLESERLTVEVVPAPVGEAKP